MAQVLSLRSPQQHVQPTVTLKQRAHVRPSELFATLTSVSLLELWFARSMVVYSMDNRVRKQTETLHMGDYVEWSGSKGFYSLHRDYKDHDAGSMRIVQLRDGLHASFHTDAGECLDFNIVARGSNAEIHCVVSITYELSTHERSHIIGAIRRMLDCLCDVAKRAHEKHELRVVSSS